MSGRRRRYLTSGLLAVVFFVLLFVVPLRWETRLIEEQADLNDVQFGRPVAFLAQDQSGVDLESYPGHVGMDTFKDAPSRILLGGLAVAATTSIVLALALVTFLNRRSHTPRT